MMMEERMMTFEQAVLATEGEANVGDDNVKSMV